MSTMAPRHELVIGNQRFPLCPVEYFFSTVGLLFQP